jgi:hypothetical protein
VDNNGYQWCILTYIDGDLILNDSGMDMCKDISIHKLQTINTYNIYTHKYHIYIQYINICMLLCHDSEWEIYPPSKEFSFRMLASSPGIRWIFFFPSVIYL